MFYFFVTDFNLMWDLSALYSIFCFHVAVVMLVTAIVALDSSQCLVLVVCVLVSCRCW